MIDYTARNNEDMQDRINDLNQLIIVLNDPEVDIEDKKLGVPVCATGLINVINLLKTTDYVWYQQNKRQLLVELQALQEMHTTLRIPLSPQIPHQIILLERQIYWSSYLSHQKDEVCDGLVEVVAAPLRMLFHPWDTVVGLATAIRHPLRTLQTTAQLAWRRPAFVTANLAGGVLLGNIAANQLVSGQTVQASGQIAQASGQAVQASSQAVQASGQAVQASSQAVQASGQIAQASGQAVQASSQAALHYAVKASGQAVQASSQAALHAVKASGQAVQASSQAALHAVKASGQAVQASSQAALHAVKASGQAVQASSQEVAKVSGISHAAIKVQAESYAALQTVNVTNESEHKSNSISNGPNDDNVKSFLSYLASSKHTPRLKKEDDNIKSFLSYLAFSKHTPRLKKENDVVNAVQLNKNGKGASVIDGIKNETSGAEISCNPLGVFSGQAKHI